MSEQVDNEISAHEVVEGFFDDDEIEMSPEMSLGECCACHGTEHVRNLVMHEFRAPVAGTGWGCVVCHLPMQGAVSVVCDHCRDAQAEIVEVCHGYPRENCRVPLSGFVREPFAHNLALHAADFVGGQA